MLDNQIGSALVVDRLAERQLQLLRNIEVVEDGHLARVQLNDVLFLGRDNLNIVLDLLEDLLVVDIDAVVGGVEKVTEQCHGASCLFMNQFG